MTGKLCCPECGCALQFTTTTSGRITCDCAESLDCRARYLFPTGGETEGEAADKFVQKCERFGYTVALDAFIADKARRDGSAT